MTQQIKYKRVLLKLSGESLMGSDPFGINHDTIVQTVGENCRNRENGRASRYRCRRR